MRYYTSIPTESYIDLLKRVAKKQQRDSPTDNQTACLARIAQFSGFQSWSSLQDNLRIGSPGKLVLTSDRNNILRGLPKAVPQAFELYVRLEAWEALRHGFIQKASVKELDAEGLERVDVYDEVLIDFVGMLPKAAVTKLISDLERDGVWGVEDIMIDEFSMSDW